MKTVGIIVEYNPLHHGHVYHFQQSRIVSEADAVIAVMSGNFLQRGEPAIVNKWARAEMALHMGADVVIELPVAYASQPAEWFAFGAVSILEATGVVESLCFGSESGDIGWLQTLARHMHQETRSFHDIIKRQLKKGISYPAAYSAAVAQYMNGEVRDEDLAKPNNILGLHYLIALQRLQSAIVPLTITRQKAGYHQQEITDRQIASATAIRRLLFKKHNLTEIAAFVPDYTYEILCRERMQGRAPLSWEAFAEPLLFQLIHRSPGELAQIHEVSEGLEYRLKQALPNLDLSSSSIVELLLTRLKTRRYTRTKLQRMLLRILLNHSKKELGSDRLRSGVPYLRILGFSQTGRELLKKMKKTAKVPIVTKVTRQSSPFLDLDIRATSIYALGYPSRDTAEIFRDYYQPPVQL